MITPSITTYKFVGRLLKPILARTLLKPGKVVQIFSGPSAGLRYKVYAGFGLSHLYGGWEPEILSLLPKIIQKGDVVFDVGSNYGLYSLLFARLVGLDGLVVAFEPVEKIRTAAQENAILNDFRQICWIGKAVADKEGLANFNSGHHEGSGHLTSVDSQTSELNLSKNDILTVDVTTLDAVSDELGTLPTLLKIDVEGAEGRALAGAKRLLQSGQPGVIIELHNPSQDVAVGQFLFEAGYRAFRIDEPGFPEVRDMRLGYPHLDGMRGHILAVRPESKFATKEFVRTHLSL